jgi:hypothetical protein
MNRRALFLSAIGILLLSGAYAGQDERITKSFPLESVERVIIRASEAEKITVVERAGKSISLSGLPVGDAKGYHSPDPNWKETPPAQWGLDFVAEKFGNTLIISTRNEILYIHHYYALRDITVEIPPGVMLEREKRQLTGGGAANLSPPKGPR